MKAKTSHKMNKRGRASLILMLLLCALTLLCAAPVIDAQRRRSRTLQRPTPMLTVSQVRGHVMRKGKMGNYPAVSVRVTLIPYAYVVQGRTQGNSNLAYTDSEGLFYFNVTPGKYLLKVWANDKESKDFLIDADRENVDHAAITVP